ncbi:MAG: STAS domain-containing protein [Planctomycetota bacterium]|nr:STAS domain-containing protein [Planctomycetota bacterium]
MNLGVHEHDGVMMLTVTGSFETVALESFSESVEGLIDGGARYFCLNLRGLEFINSTALGYLVGKAKELKKDGGALVLSEPSRFFTATFRTLELHHIFELFKDDDEAVHYFAKKRAGGAT